MAIRLRFFVLALMLALSLTLTPMVAKPADAWFSCYGRTHYHNNYRIPTKHVNTGKTYSPDRNVYRLWEIKKDRDGDGNYSHVRFKYTLCGLPT